jgi:maltooligosyltrehalose trehalohydrolase
MRALGAVPVEPGLVEYRVWAPNAREVTCRGRRLEPEADGVFAARLEDEPGAEYSFELDGGSPLADPCSRWQPDGLRGLSRVLDPTALEVSADPVAVALEELVIYELHIGTFTAKGTFDAAAERLPALAEVGVTAVEVMPVATFPGERGWGYDGVFAYAPHRAYGGPQGLARFVDAAHRAGLAVILDVVYNHVGPGSEMLSAFGPYFTDRYDTFWGAAIDYAQRGVREWAVQNAELWVRDYRIDGLRLDATHAIFDESDPHVLHELADRVRLAHPRALVTSEMEIGDRRPIEEWGHDAQWADEFHHALHVLLTGEQEGYYSSYGSVADLARAYEETPAEKLVICTTNHDQVGNRALGDRLPAHMRRLVAACTLFAPQVPLLFQGDEYGEKGPFQFFTDHDDPAIAEATREGRRNEFAKFAAFSKEDVPDPQARETFEASKLHPETGDDKLRRFYRSLIELRGRLPREVTTQVDERAKTIRVRRGDHELVADFANVTVEIRTVQAEGKAA